MTYAEALQAGACARYLDEILNRFNYWNHDNATPDSVIFHEYTDRDGVTHYAVRRKEATR